MRIKYLRRCATPYNEQDQLTGQTIDRTSSDGTTHRDILAYGHSAGNADALTSATDTVAGVPTTTNYHYDGVGNLTSTQVDTNTPTTLGTSNSVNQYSTLTYNARGDVTYDGTYTYGYDANDRMISITPDDTTQYQLKYGYDSSGRRLWKDVYSHSTGSWALAYSRHYVWDGTNLVAELDGTNALLTGYTWGPTGLLAVTDYTASGGPKTYVAISDLSGNVIELTDPLASGSAKGVVADYHYDAYGNLLVNTNGLYEAYGPAAAVCGFRGKGLFYDSEAPSIGHALLRDTRSNVWLERDPIGEQGGTNLHELYDGDPINKGDTLGTTTLSEALIAGRGVIAAGDVAKIQLTLAEAEEINRSVPMGLNGIGPTWTAKEIADGKTYWGGQVKREADKELPDILPPNRYRIKAMELNIERAKFVLMFRSPSVEAYTKELYKFIRASNPVHFVVEESFALGQGWEPVLNEDANRIDTAKNLVLYLAIMKAASSAQSATRNYYFSSNELSSSAGSEVGRYTETIKWGVQNINVRPDGPGFWGERIPQTDSEVNA